ncbi:right-handed parallel beta-helix repeat-containing protein [candidate division KSB1 bacterium]|nr:right-handed parallel beta-helix repeat-containing protein [candidate division KSB1 bacterium]
MKTNRFVLIILIFLMFISFIQAQTLYNGVGHIPSSYQQTWNVAGLLQDMSTTTPAEAFVVTGTNGDTDTELAAAIADAKYHVDQTDGLAIIYFPEGTFYLDDPITLTHEYRNIVFQGAGSDRTNLVFRNMKNSHCFNLYGIEGSWIDLEENFDKGDKRIYPASGTWSTGDWIHFYVYNYDFRKDPPLPESELEIVGQITKIENMGTDANGDYLEIKDEANMNYKDLDGDGRPMRVRKITPIRNIGIENLKIKRTPNEKADDYYYNIKFNNAVNCWVRGVESYKPSRSHLAVTRSSHLEITGCYFHEAMDYCGGGWGYGVSLESSTTNCLVENNIFRCLRHSMIAVAGSNCNVWTFNYSCEQHSTGSPPTYRDLDLHAKWPFGHLFEHNIVETIGSDDAHGANGFYNTFVRNWATENNVDFKKMEYWSTLGNIKYVEPLYAPYFTYDHGPITDRFGYKENYTLGIIHNSVAYYPSDGNACELKDVSYYYSARPDFLPSSSYSWPALGCKYSYGTSLTQSIPAKGRFNYTKKTYLPNPTPKPLTTAGTLPYDQTWSGTHTLTGNVTVPSGITLTIEPGTAVSIPHSNSINIEGTLIAEGTDGNEITFNSVSGIWGGLKFLNSSVDAACIVKYCDIQHATYGVYINQAGPTIQNCELHNNMYGFYAYNGTAASAVTVEDNIFRNNIYGIQFSYPISTFYVESNDSYANASRNVYLYSCLDKIEISYNDIYDSSDLGIYLFASYPYVYRNNIYQNDGHGIACYYGSHFDLFSDTNYGQNWIYDNGNHGIYIDSNSLPTLGWWNYGCPSANHFENNTNYHVYSLQSLEVLAQYNYWDDHTNVYGNVNTAGYMEKAIAKEPNDNMLTGDPRARELLAGGREKMRQKEYASAVNTFKSIVTNYPDDHASWLALTFIDMCYHRAETKDNSVFPFFTSVMNANSGIVGGKARELYAEHLHLSGRFDDALKMYSILETKFPKTMLAKKALYDTWMVNYFQKEDTPAALAARNKLEADFPNDEWVYMMKTAMGEQAELPDPNIGKENAEDITEKTVDKFAVYANYPNPFNPETLIKYDVPEADHVEITVFDIQGRKVTTLINSQVESGQHSVTWRGRDAYGRQVASGMYFYRTSYRDYIVSRKMLLMR